MKAFWLSSEEKIPGVAVCKEGDADSILGQEWLITINFLEKGPTIKMLPLANSEDKTSPYWMTLVHEYIYMYVCVCVCTHVCVCVCVCVYPVLSLIHSTFRISLMNLGWNEFRKAPCVSQVVSTPQLEPSSGKRIMKWQTWRWFIYIYIRNRRKKKRELNLRKKRISLEVWGRINNTPLNKFKFENSNHISWKFYLPAPSLECLNSMTVFLTKSLKSSIGFRLGCLPRYVSPNSSCLGGHPLGEVFSPVWSILITNVSAFRGKIACDVRDWHLMFRILLKQV